MPVATVFSFTEMVSTTARQQTQQTITNKLFQAPLFLHQAPYTDFLVVRPFRRKGQPNLPVEAVVRPISRIYVVRVPSPIACRACVRPR